MSKYSYHIEVAFSPFSMIKLFSRKLFHTQIASCSEDMLLDDFGLVSFSVFIFPSFFSAFFTNKNWTTFMLYKFMQR